MNRTSKIVVVLATVILGSALAVPTSMAAEVTPQYAAGPTWCC